MILYLKYNYNLLSTGYVNFINQGIIFQYTSLDVLTSIRNQKKCDHLKLAIAQIPKLIDSPSTNFKIILFYLNFSG
jgi:hypothetical protein